MGIFSILIPTKAKVSKKLWWVFLHIYKACGHQQLNWQKFSRFFTCLAIERAANAWWDTKERCVVTKADAELEDIINQDIDLMFPEDAIIVDLTQVQETAADVGMSTGSISTFHTTATPSKGRGKTGKQT